MTLTGGTGLCGGALIGSRTILTAAHCVDATSSVLVILGAHVLNPPPPSVEPNQQRQTVNNPAQIIIHPEWTPELIRQDIAIVHLNTPATINPFVQIIRRATGIRTFENDPATVR